MGWEKRKVITNVVLFYHIYMYIFYILHVGQSIGCLYNFYIYLYISSEGQDNEHNHINKRQINKYLVIGN